MTITSEQLRNAARMGQPAADTLNKVADQQDALLKALRETTDVLEVLRRGHGVGHYCFPALDTARDVLATHLPPIDCRVEKNSMRQMEQAKAIGVTTCRRGVPA